MIRTRIASHAILPGSLNLRSASGSVKAPRSSSAGITICEFSKAGGARKACGRSGSPERVGASLRRRAYPGRAGFGSGRRRDDARSRGACRDQESCRYSSVKGKPYREELRVYTAGSLCEVVNVVDLEKYLEGLVNAEFNSRWSEEAIGAQVVAARTYAVFQMRQAQAQAEDNSDAQHYDVDATTHDQVYDGSMKEDPRATRIVEKTRGLLLTVKTARGVEPLKAYYHSTCGGMTDCRIRVWGTSEFGISTRDLPVLCAFSAGALELRSDERRNRAALQARGPRRANGYFEMAQRLEAPAHGRSTPRGSESEI